MSQERPDVTFSISPVRLTDEQWAKIDCYSGLPGEARKKIEMIIGMYRHFRDDDAARPTAYKMRDHLDSIYKETSALCAKLQMMDKLDSPFSFLAHETPGGLPRNTELRHEGQEIFDNAIYALRSVLGWCQWTRDEIEDMPRGAARKAWNVYWLVSALASTLEDYSGKKIRRSNKRVDTSVEYIMAACAIADPTIGKGAIDEAMKHTIKMARGEIPRNSAL